MDGAERALLEAVDGKRDRLVQGTRDLVATPTVNSYSGDDSAGTEGPGQEWVVQRLRSLGAAVAFAAVSLVPAAAEIVSDSYELTAESSAPGAAASWRDVAYDTWMAGYRAAGDERAGLSAQLIVGTRSEKGITYDPSQVRTGGIDLGAVGQLRRRGDVEGLFVDGGKLWVKVRRNEAPQALSPRLAADVAVLANAIYQHPHHAAWLTIDPPAEEEARRRYGEVKYGGGIENTHVGMVLFESDRLLKSLSIGYDNRTGAVMAPGPWHRSEWDFVPAAYFERGPVRASQWRRYWFTTEETAVEVDAVHRVVRLTGPPLVTKTERMRLAGGRMESAGEGSPDNRWTAHFNRHFERYLEAYPVLRELDELARWAALLTGLRESGILLSQVELEGVYRGATPGRTAVVTACKTRRTVEEESATSTVTRTREVTIFGGVGLEQVQITPADLGDVKRRWLAEAGAADALVEAIF